MRDSAVKSPCSCTGPRLSSYTHVVAHNHLVLLQLSTGSNTFLPVPGMHTVTYIHNMQAEHPYT